MLESINGRLASRHVVVNWPRRPRLRWSHDERQRGLRIECHECWAVPSPPRLSDGKSSLCHLTRWRPRTSSSHFSSHLNSPILISLNFRHGFVLTPTSLWRSPRALFTVPTVPICTIPRHILRPATITSLRNNAYPQQCLSKDYPRPPESSWSARLESARAPRPSA